MAAIRCYLQRVIFECEVSWRGVTRGITNYLSLLREIECTRKNDEPVALATFNYDTLLDQAVESFGQKIERMADYVERPTLFRLFKLHGSVNWARVVENGIPANINREHPPSVLHFLIGQAANLSISDRFVLCTPSSMGMANKLPVFPAIAVPIEAKRTFECPKEMVNQIDQVIPDVSKLLIIGWRATEEHFLEKLRQGLRPDVHVYIVAGGPNASGEHPGEIIRTHLIRSLRYQPVDAQIDPSGFTDFLSSGRAKEFLES